MVFINEYISRDDWKKYNIDEIDKRFIIGGTKSRDWTIDKNIYIRNVARGREDTAHISTWTLFWSGQLIVFKLENISTSGVPKGSRHGHKKITKIDIPEDLSKEKDEIIDTLREAFIAYKDGGVFSTVDQYGLILSVE